MIKYHYTAYESEESFRTIYYLFSREAVTNGSYRKVKFTSGEFTCSYSWTGIVTPPFKPEKASNNHLIPADRAMARGPGLASRGHRQGDGPYPRRSLRQRNRLRPQA